MSPPPTPPTRRWPLRVALAVVLTGLVLTGARALPSAHPRPTTSSAPAGATTTLPAVTTTTTPAPAPLDRPVTSPAAFDPPRRGCAMNLGTATATTTTIPAPTTSPATTTTSAAARVARLGRCTVLEVGDSIGNDLGWGLARELATPGLRLIQVDKSSTGLSATWFFNWPRHLAADLRRYHPNLVIVCLGANDEQAIAVRGVSRAFGSEAWADTYRARIRRLTAMASHAGSYVLWVGLPIVEPPQYRRGVNFLNAQYRKVVPTVPGATFLPTWRLLADPQGNYRAGGLVNGGQAALRAADGIHFTVVGEDVFATFVAHQVSAIYHVRLVLRAPLTLAH